MFIRFPCGCIGFDIQNEHGKHLIVAPCDGGPDDPPVTLYWRDMKGKIPEPLPMEATLSLVSDLMALVQEGIALRQTRAMVQRLKDAGFL